MLFDFTSENIILTRLAVIHLYNFFKALGPQKWPKAQGLWHMPLLPCGYSGPACTQTFHPMYNLKSWSVEIEYQNITAMYTNNNNKTTSITKMLHIDYYLLYGI